MKNKILIIGLSVVVLLGIALLAFVISAMRPLLDQDSQNGQIDSGALKEGWTYQNSARCGVEIPLPPRRDPYVSERGEYWRFSETTQETGEPFLPHTAVTIFHNPELGGSGYVAGAVIVSCRENPQRDSLDEVAKQYADYFIRQNERVPEEARITLRQARKDSVWGNEVLVVNLQGGMFNPEDEFYVMATRDFAYIISKPQMSADPFVRQTTEEIFSKMKFK